MPRRGQRCDCPGCWQSRLSRWVILQQVSEKVYQLYCLDCRWRWKSRAKYAAKLRFYSPQSRKGMSDEDILTRLIAGNLRIHPETAAVESLRNGKWITLKAVPDQHGSGYLFVKVNFQRKQKKIAIHRLQWMACHLALIPAGYDVHHIRSPPRPRPKPNNIGNLELRESDRNRSKASPDYEWCDAEYLPP